MKECLNYAFERSDLYFVALLKAKSLDIVPEHQEGIQEARWVSQSELTMKGENSGMILKTFAPGFGATKEMVSKEISSKLFENPIEFLELTSMTPNTYKFLGKTHTLFMPTLTKAVGEQIQQTQKL